MTPQEGNVRMDAGNVAQQPVRIVHNAEGTGINRALTQDRIRKAKAGAKPRLFKDADFGRQAKAAEKKDKAARRKLQTVPGPKRLSRRPTASQ